MDVFEKLTYVVVLNAAFTIFEPHDVYESNLKSSFFGFYIDG